MQVPFESTLERILLRLLGTKRGGGKEEEKLMSDSRPAVLHSLLPTLHFCLSAAAFQGDSPSL